MSYILLRRDSVSISLLQGLVFLQKVCVTCGSGFIRERGVVRTPYLFPQHRGLFAAEAAPTYGIAYLLVFTASVYTLMPQELYVFLNKISPNTNAARKKNMAPVVIMISCRLGLYV